MTHDPLCPAPACAMTGRFRLLCDDCDLAHEECRCVCGLLARARAEERGRTLDAARKAVIGTCGHTKYEGCSPCSHDDAVAAIDALRTGQEAEPQGHEQQPQAHHPRQESTP